MSRPLLVAASLLIPLVSSGADAPPAPKAPASKAASIIRLPEVDSRQVTLFGILVVPDGKTVDPKLERLRVPLRRLKPNSGFTLRGSASRRLTRGESVTCDLGGGVVARTELLDPMNLNGKVQFRFTLLLAGQPEFTTTVTTPPNQVFYIEKTLPGSGERILIGVGGR